MWQPREAVRVVDKQTAEPERQSAETVDEEPQQGKDVKANSKWAPL